MALLGPRQSGKTTLARSIVHPSDRNYFDLEMPASLAALDPPMAALGGLRGTVVIDEIQHRPDLFPILRVLADRRPLPARFLVLGSASPHLLRHVSESLAGRVETIELMGFSLREVGDDHAARHWRRGGFPRSFLARSERDSVAWRADFLRTFLERDVPQFGVTVPAPTLLRFWRMLAHFHGNVWNAAEFARSMGVSEPTVRRYLDLMSGLFMVRQLQPWHENLGKRQIKSPKVYIRDTGLLHQLLSITTQAQLLSHPKVGASWEGYVIEECIRACEPDEAHFWGTHQGAELDLFMTIGGRRYGVEVKREDAPRLTPSMRIALADLKLQHLTVLYPGERSYSIGERATVMPLTALVRDPRALLGRPA